MVTKPAAAKIAADDGPLWGPAKITREDGPLWDGPPRAWRPSLWNRYGPTLTPKTQAEMNAAAIGLKSPPVFTPRPGWLRSPPRKELKPYQATKYGPTGWPIGKLPMMGVADQEHLSPQALGDIQREIAPVNRTPVRTDPRDYPAKPEFSPDPTPVPKAFANPIGVRGQPEPPVPFDPYRDRGLPEPLYDDPRPSPLPARPKLPILLAAKRRADGMADGPDVAAGTNASAGPRSEPAGEEPEAAVRGLLAQRARNFITQQYPADLPVSKPQHVRGDSHTPYGGLAPTVPAAALPSKPASPVIPPSVPPDRKPAPPDKLSDKPPDKKPDTDLWAQATSLAGKYWPHALVGTAGVALVYALYQDMKRRREEEEERAKRWERLPKAASFAGGFLQACRDAKLSGVETWSYVKQAAALDPVVAEQFSGLAKLADTETGKLAGPPSAASGVAARPQPFRRIA